MEGFTEFGNPIRESDAAKKALKFSNQFESK